MGGKKTSLAKHGHKQARDAKKLMNTSVPEKKFKFGSKKVPI